MDKFDFYQKHYFYELEKHFQINNSLSIPLGVLGLLSSALGYFTTNFTIDNSWVTYAFIVTLVCAGLSILLTVYFQFRVYRKYSYDYIADPDDILNYEKELLAYHRKNNHKNVLSLVASEVEDMLIRKYSSAATYNASNNLRKSTNLRRANAALALLVIFFFLSAPLFFWNYHTHKILNNVKSEVVMAKDQDSEKKQREASRERRKSI